MHEVKHYDPFRSVVEMCKASGTNFSIICTANIDLAMKDLEDNGKIKTGGSFKDGGYLKLDGVDSAVVDKMTEEICLSTRFLSLSFNSIHSGSK